MNSLELQVLVVIARVERSEGAPGASGSTDVPRALQAGRYADLASFRRTNRGRARSSATVV